MEEGQPGSPKGSNRTGKSGYRDTFMTELSGTGSSRVPKARDFSHERRLHIKKRNIAVATLLLFLTCGLYAIYWEICLVNDLKKASGDENAKSGGTVFLLSLITCSIYWLFWIFRAGETMDAIKAKNGVPASNRSLVYLLLSIFGLGLVAIAILQNDLNTLAASVEETAAEMPKQEDNNDTM